MMQLQSRSNRRPLSLHLNEEQEQVDIIGRRGEEEERDAKWDWAEMDEMGRVRPQQSCLSKFMQVCGEVRA